jgi:hypothetical protein
MLRIRIRKYFLVRIFVFFFKKKHLFLNKIIQYSKIKYILKILSDLFCFMYLKCINLYTDTIGSEITVFTIRIGDRNKCTI